MTYPLININLYGSKPEIYYLPSPHPIKFDAYVGNNVEDQRTRSNLNSSRNPSYLILDYRYQIIVPFDQTLLDYHVNRLNNSEDIYLNSIARVNSMYLLTQLVRLNEIFQNCVYNREIVLSIFALIREILKSLDKKLTYPTLQAYCNFLLHSELNSEVNVTHFFNISESLIQKLNNNTSQNNNTAQILSDLFKFDLLFWKCIIF